MRKETCPREGAVARAVADNDLSEELLTHLAACAECRQAAEVAVWLRAVGESEVADDAPRPAAQFVWWKARFEREDELKRRATLPLVVAQTAALVLCAVAAAGILIWQHESIERFFFQTATALPIFMGDAVTRWPTLLGVGFCLAAFFFAFRAAPDRR
jgi:hypothetical protein